MMPPAGTGVVRDLDQSVIVCEEVQKFFGSFEVLKRVNLKVARGEVFCIVGPSGGGKSTFLRTLNGLETFDAGRIRIGNIELPGTRREVIEIRRDVGMVFQNFNLFPHMTVRRSVALAPVRARGLSWRDANERSERLLARVRIADQADKYPGQISGGQQQRAAIARALAMEPKILLFDEPTSSLDPEMVQEVLQVMRDLAHTGITMIIVTHEMGFAREAADHVAFMAEGMLLHTAPPTQFFDCPTDARLISFLSKVL
jgi:ABC-type polar amino acid transport system ATPase subunit